MRRRAWLAAAVVVGALLTGCTGAPPSDPGPDPGPDPEQGPARGSGPPADQLQASVAQFRFDEGTRRLRAGITNGSNQDVRVTRATITWTALAFPTVALPDEAVPPGQTAAFRISYGRPRCGGDRGDLPVMTAVVDGRARTLPLRVEDPGLLVRLHAKACAAQRLDVTATVDLDVESASTVVDDEEYLPGAVVVRRRGAGQQEPVRIVDVGGSVLIDLRPRGGRAALPGVLPPGEPVLSFPVLLGSAHRCDPHALGQSSQTFLLSAYLRLADRPVQRVVLSLTPAERGLLTAVVRRDCR